MTGIRNEGNMTELDSAIMELVTDIMMPIEEDDCEFRDQMESRARESFKHLVSVLKDEIKSETIRELGLKVMR